MHDYRWLVVAVKREAGREWWPTSGTAGVGRPTAHVAEALCRAAAGNTACLPSSDRS